MENTASVSLKKTNDLVKLALDENLREYDKVVSPARVTGAFEISLENPQMFNCKLY